MTSDFIQHSIIAGELAPNMLGRTDFQKYDMAMAMLKNWLVDYRGGMFTRPGQEFGDVIEWTEGEDVKFIPFQYSPDTENTYLLILTNDKIRFAQDNAYVLEGDIAVASLANDVGDRVEFTTTGSHGYANGDWIKLSGFATNTFFNNQTFEVANKTATTFTLLSVIDGAAIDVASVTTEAGVVNAIYTIASPYGQEDLANLSYLQIRDELRLTHLDYGARNLIRTSATSWAFSAVDFSLPIGPVTGLSLDSKSNDDNYGCVYQVTGVNEDGEEGLPDIVLIINSAAIESVASRWIKIDWSQLAGAVSYNVYRSNEINANSDINPSMPVGFIANVAGRSLIDQGITPDFSRKPPVEYNPFANGRIRYVTVVAGGTGASYSSTIIWPGGGSGAYGWLMTENPTSATIHGVNVLSGGKDYTDVTVSVAAAASENLDAVLSPATGNNPACVCIFEQRVVYGATDNFPMRLFGSRIGLFNNFGYSPTGADDESYEFDLDSETVANIRHLRPVQGGILVMNQIGVWLVYGGGNASLSGNNAKADLQTRVGAYTTDPQYVDGNLAYVSHDGQEIRLAVYSDEAQSYLSQNLSLISNHLFTPANPIKSIAYAAVPSKIIYSVQENGAMLASTVDGRNDVFGTSPQATKGYYRECLTISEERQSKLYIAVERIINGNRVLFFERQTDRTTMKCIEDTFCVDAGLKLAQAKPAARVVPDTFTGAVTFTASASVFTADDVGKVLRYAGAKATISTYTSGTVISGTWVLDLETFFPEDEDAPSEFYSGDWTLTDPVSSVTGLWHLEGEAVAVVADGIVIEGKTVSGGSISLATPASSIVVGLAYTCKAKTLPLATVETAIEGRRKNIKGVALRQHESTGLKMGPNFDKARLIANRLQRLSGSDDKLRDYMTYEPVRTDWNYDTPMCFLQDQPLPAAILSFIKDTEVGDDRE